MLKLSKMSDYAVVMMAFMGQRAQDNHTATSVAAHTGLTIPTVRKLMKSLSKAGLLASSRGVHGGYTLTRSTDSICVSDIVEAIDGPVSLTTCLDEKTACGCIVADTCPTKHRWRVINSAVIKALADVKLSSFIEPDTTKPAQ